MINMNISNIAGIALAMQSIKGKVQEKVIEAHSKAALELQNEVKLSIAGYKAEPRSVDTGRFLNSVDFSVDEDNAYVFTLIPYGKFLEFGTSRLNPRRHFNNSAFRKKDDIARKYLAEIKSIK